jgi:hypothetical protein
MGSLDWRTGAFTCPALLRFEATFGLLLRP